MSAFYNAIYDVVYNVMFAFGWMVKTNWTGKVSGGFVEYANARLGCSISAASITSDIMPFVMVAIALIAILIVIDLIRFACYKPAEKLGTEK